MSQITSTSKEQALWGKSREGTERVSGRLQLCSHVGNWGKRSRQKAQQEQRPYGESVPHDLEDSKEAAVVRAEGARGEEQGKWVTQGLVGCHLTHVQIPLRISQHTWRSHKMSHHLLYWALSFWCQGPHWLHLWVSDLQPQRV